MPKDNNYHPKPEDNKYKEFSERLIAVRDELGILLLEESWKKGNSIEFPSLGITIYSEKKKD